YEILPNCNVSDKRSLTLLKDSWTYTTNVINYTSCKPIQYQLLLADIYVSWKAEITTVKVEAGGVEKVVGVKNVDDGAQIMHIVIISSI
ncbi:MAG: hypothetical protein QW596_00805, partial [Sulfolobales archaeon]